MPDDKLIKSILEAQKAFDIRPYAAAIEKATRASRSIANLRQAMEGYHAHVLAGHSGDDALRRGLRRDPGHRPRSANAASLR